MFTITGVIVRLFHEKQAKIARDWRAAGEANLAAERSVVAIEDFRNALLYSPDSTQLQLELAQALTEQGQFDEAQDYLLNLRTADPENSLINLQLARIAVRRADVDAATTYFHDAMYGHWPNNPHTNQLATRKELIEFFLSHNRRDAARAESLSMAADNPADPDVRVQAADFLLQAGDAQSSLAEYQRVLRMEPDNADALAGSGKAALATGRFAQAARYFNQAILHGSQNPEIERDRDVSSEAAELDPYDVHLNDRGRQRRILRMFDAAHARVKSCFPVLLEGSKVPVPDQLKTLAAERVALPKQLTGQELALHPELEKTALAWVFDVERSASSQCGTGTVTDAAIELIAGQHKET
ncbi:MAG TPA: tetratricopeptide repeat protein [Candidatus Acidoferrum sp.]|nr:tetratricopeptide repeat protein [Candidatus Acidoferrum sp.]